jgi:hypothetical protein
VAGTMLDAPLPGVASVEDLPVSFFALDSFWMPEDLETVSGAKGCRMGAGSTSYCDNIARNVSSVICGWLSKHIMQQVFQWAGALLTSSISQPYFATKSLIFICLTDFGSFSI